MFKTKGIDHLNLTVKSVDKAKVFYRDYFGFKVHRDYDYTDKSGKASRFLLIGITGKVMLCLYEDPDCDQTKSTLSHFGINVENFDESFDIARSNGILNEELGIISYENSRSFYVTDPNGLSLEISELFAGGH